jgi:predicted nuclease of predicted toxin-antitoxin system
MDDDDVIQKAFAENWILITNDRDFGEKVYRERRLHKGIILLRLDDERASIKIQTIKRLLSSHAESLPGQFVVVTERTVRLGRVQ